MVYIEGEGGGAARSTSRKKRDGEFRQSWKAFLEPLAEHAREKGIVFFRCIPGRGGSTCLDTFANPLPAHQGALRVLLVDSEKPVANVKKPWEALPGSKPAWATDDHCYLMVQCLETWLLADIEGLRRHYDSVRQCFDVSALRSWPKLEETNRTTLQEALEKATERCRPAYGHADGNLIIAKLDREKLKNLDSVRRLFTDLEQVITAYAES